MFVSARQVHDGTPQKETGLIDDGAKTPSTTSDGAKKHNQAESIGVDTDRDATQNACSEDEQKDIAGDAPHVGGGATTHTTLATSGGDAEEMEEISPDFSDNAILPQGSDKTTEAIDSALKDLPPKYVLLPLRPNKKNYLFPVYPTDPIFLLADPFFFRITIIT